MNQKAIEVAARLAAEVAPEGLQWLGGALFGPRGAEHGQALGEQIRARTRQLSQAAPEAAWELETTNTVTVAATPTTRQFRARHSPSAALSQP